MHLCPGSRSVAAGEGAPVAVAQGQRAALCGREEPSRSAEVEWHGVATEDGRQDAGVAGHPPGGARGDGVTGWEQRGAEAAAQVGPADGDHHGGGLATGVGQATAGAAGRSEEPAADLSKGVGLALAAGARVRALFVGRPRLRERFERCVEECGGRRVRASADPGPAVPVRAQRQVATVRPGLLTVQGLAEEAVGLIGATTSRT
jgi:hypothetical protein